MDTEDAGPPRGRGGGLDDAAEEDVERAVADGGRRAAVE